ncbi:MAG: hypothetical protein AB9903_09170 [Vulcanimicrobiota bacterium]
MTGIVPIGMQADEMGSTTKEWCLATGAIINLINCDRHDLLGGRSLNSSQK